MRIIDRKKRFFVYGLNFFLFLFTAPTRAIRRKGRVEMNAPGILVSRPDRLGDVIMSTPVFHSLKERFPKSRIVMICYPAAESFMRNNPYIDEVWPVHCPWWHKGSIGAYIKFFIAYKKIYKKIKNKRFDIFIELRGDIRHNFLFGWLPDIPMRISNDRSGGNFLLTHPLKFKFELHEIEKNYQLLSFFEPFQKYFKTEIYADPDRDFFKKFSIGQNFVVIFNGGRSPLRRLSEDKIVELVTALAAEYNVQCIMVGDKADEDLANKVICKVENKDALINTCGKLTLPQVKVLVDNAVLFIGTDSSINHIAASTNTPSISLYGPMVPSQVRQLGQNKMNIFHEYECSPCLQKKCLVTNSHSKAQCMEDITSEEIINLAGQFLETNYLIKSVKD